MTGKSHIFHPHTAMALCNSLLFIEIILIAREVKNSFVISGRRIFVIWDVPHLLKCTRNQFVSKKRLKVRIVFLVNANHRTLNIKISFVSILSFPLYSIYSILFCVCSFVNRVARCLARTGKVLIYMRPLETSTGNINSPEQHLIKLAFKLRIDHHLNPNNFGKQKVRYAVQLFSESVARALSVREVPFSEATQAFLRFFDELFDRLNSSHFRDKPTRRPVEKPTAEEGDSRKKDVLTVRFLIYFYFVQLHSF